MKAVPHKWTDHHTHRLFHLTMLTHASFLVIMILSSSLIWAWQVQSTSILITAEVHAINPSPAVILDPNNGGSLFSGKESSLPQEKAPSSRKPSEMTLDQKEPAVIFLPFVPDLKSPGKALPALEKINIPGIGPVPLVRASAPVFSGHTNIPFAWIYLEIHSLVVRATTQADEHGNWSWQSSENLENGLHRIVITSIDPNDDQIQASSEYNFYIDPHTIPEARPLPANKPSPNNRDNLFDVLVSIPTQFKEISAGDQLLAKIKLVNFGKVGHPVDVGVSYTIEDEQNNLIMENSETVAVATQLSYVKTFQTASNLPVGQYRLIVRVPSEDLIATSTEVFGIVHSPLAAISAGKQANSLMFQGLMGLLFLFSLILYFEYNKVVTLSHHIRMITEKDLPSQI